MVCITSVDIYLLVYREVEEVIRSTHKRANINTRLVTW